jgi:hypothetical protein
MRTRIHISRTTTRTRVAHSSQGQRRGRGGRRRRRPQTPRPQVGGRRAGRRPIRVCARDHDVVGRRVPNGRLFTASSLMSSLFRRFLFKFQSFFRLILFLVSNHLSIKKSFISILKSFPSRPTPPSAPPASGRRPPAPPPPLSARTSFVSKKGCVSMETEKTRI